MLALSIYLLYKFVIYTDFISSASPAPIRIASALISEAIATSNILTPVVTSTLPTSATSDILSTPVTSNFRILGHDRSLVKKILTLLTELMASVNDIHRDLTILSAQVQSSRNTEVDDDIFEICELPISNMTEFNQLMRG